MTDEAYEQCIYEGELASVWGAPNVVLVRSLGKSLALPSWRIGFLAAAGLAALTAAFILPLRMAR